MGDTRAAQKMIDVPPGQVTLSDRRTQRSWAVELAPYRLAAVPVTQQLYAEITDLRPSTTIGDLLPVESVSWWDAVRFCNALSARDGFTPAYLLPTDGDDDETIEWDASADGYRLPTEAEWEHACRAGTSGPHYGELDEIAWHRANSQERIHPVGGKQPNSWGLHDMLGNAWDWCWDVYDPEVYGSSSVRRTSRRSHPSYRVDDVGFRLARSVPR
ncbi:formylglycine-generating enzyme family protein [Streptomyces beijiangensis]|nr:SUMF1/EgtB/PvdO family nonheme iron enzyme [Streptomyces beijiangensis]